MLTDRQTDGQKSMFFSLLYGFIAIFATFLSTELYVFEVPVISYSPLYYAQK